MSGSYLMEPDTKGEVLLHTTHGVLQVLLWSKEAPKACRNFVQNCLEGYYSGCLFHRLIKDFMVQTGDPSGTGQTCESIYGKEGYGTESHGRLQYRYRGMLGVANRGKKTNSNGSQFFITLAPARDLHGVNTLFGKVSTQTCFSLMKITEVETDPKTDRPVSDGSQTVPMILRAEVVWNPFDDIDIRPLKIQENTMRSGETLKRMGLSVGGLGVGDVGDGGGKQSSTQGGSGGNKVAKEAIQATKNKAMISIDDSEDEESEDGKGGMGNGGKNKSSNAISASQKPSATTNSRIAVDKGATKKRRRSDSGSDSDERKRDGRRKDSYSEEKGGRDERRDERRDGKRRKNGDSDNSDQDSDQDIMSTNNRGGSSAGISSGDHSRDARMANLKSQIMGDLTKLKASAENKGEKQKPEKKKKKKRKEILAELSEGFTKGVVRSSKGGRTWNVDSGGYSGNGGGPSATQIQEDKGDYKSLRSDYKSKKNPNNDTLSAISNFADRLKNAKRVEAVVAHANDKPNDNTGTTAAADDQHDTEFALTGGLKFQVTGDKAYQIVAEREAREKEERERKEKLMGGKKSKR